jgi:hypothetical protein
MNPIFRILSLQNESNVQNSILQIAATSQELHVSIPAEHIVTDQVKQLS